MESETCIVFSNEDHEFLKMLKRNQKTSRDRAEDASTSSSMDNVTTYTRSDEDTHIQRECKLDVNVEEYVESTVRPYLMDVIYCWSKGATFAEVIEMTEIFEGSIIRLARRLDEFLNQLKGAAHAVGETNLEKKFESGSESLRRGIMFANSLYL